MPTSRNASSKTATVRRKLLITRKRSAATGTGKRRATSKARTPQKPRARPVKRRRRVVPAAVGAAGTKEASRARTRPLAFTRIEDAPPDLQQRAHQRMAWVAAVASRPPKQSVQSAIAAHAERLGLTGDDIPRRTTVDTWVRLAKVDGILALVDRVRSDAGTCRGLRELSPRVRACIGPLDELIEDVLVGIRGSAIDVYVELQRLLKRNGVSMSYHTVARHVRAWQKRNPHLVYVAREGLGAFRDDARLSIG